MNYLKNEDILREAESYTARKKIDPNARMTHDMAKMLLSICQNLVTSKFFNKYQKVHDDMIGDAMANLVRRSHNFDVTKSKSAFSFFTAAIFFSFLGTLKQERKHLRIKMTGYRKGLENIADISEIVGEEYANDIIKDIRNETEKKSDFLKRGGTLTARRNRFNKKPISDYYEREIGSLYDIELWIDATG